MAPRGAEKNALASNAKELLIVLLLGITAPFTAAGVQLKCYLEFGRGSPDPWPGTGLLPGYLYWLAFSFTVAWVLALAFNVWRLRGRRALQLAHIVPAVIFVFAARQTLLMAYPVCNAF
jgi:hypothetical protein